MFTPTWVQLKYWYHPIHNIPAVDLLRDLPLPDVEETVNVLSLACGDPGNIFSSLWCEQGHETNRTIHFTCYDIEPVLLTLTAGTNSRTELWDLSCSFFLPKSSLETLRNKVARLLKASESTEKWVLSPCGKCIQFVDKATLQHLRKYWTRFGSTEEWPQTRKAIERRSKEIEDVQLASGVQDAGPSCFRRRT